MLRLRAVRCLLGHGSLAALALVLTTRGAPAQVEIHPVGPRMIDPAEAVAELASGRDVGHAILAAFLHDRVETLGEREGNYERYTGAQRRQLLDGLESIARRKQVPPEARTAAFSTLRMIYLHPEIDAPEQAQIPARLLRIYDLAEGMSSKALALHGLGWVLAHSPPQTPEIIERMVEVASGPGPPGSVAPWTAIRALLQACHAGRPVLAELADEDLVRRNDLGAAAYLERLVKRGIPVEEMEAQRLGMPCPNPRGRYP